MSAIYIEASLYLLHTGSEERGVLGASIIPVAIPQDIVKILHIIAYTLI